MRGKLNLIAGTEQNCLSGSLLYGWYLSVLHMTCVWYISCKSLEDTITNWHRLLFFLSVPPVRQSSLPALFCLDIRNALPLLDSSCQAPGQHNQLIQTATTVIAKLFLCFDLVCISVWLAWTTPHHTADWTTLDYRTYLGTGQLSDCREPGGLEQYLHSLPQIKRELSLRKQ